MGPYVHRIELGPSPLAPRRQSVRMGAGLLAHLPVGHRAGMTIGRYGREISRRPTSRWTSCSQQSATGPTAVSMAPLGESPGQRDRHVARRTLGYGASQGAFLLRGTLAAPDDELRRFAYDPGREHQRIRRRVGQSHSLACEGGLPARSPGRPQLPHRGRRPARGFERLTVAAADEPLFLKIFSVGLCRPGAFNPTGEPRTNNQEPVSVDWRPALDLRLPGSGGRI